MKCPNCSAENKEGTNFCAMCGSKLQLTCPKCGAPSDTNLNFCGACGAKLAISGDVATPESHPTEARKAEAPAELAGGWVSDFGAAGWGRGAFWDSIRGDLGKDIRPREGEEMIFAGRSSLDLHLFSRGFDSSEMTPVAGFMGTNQRMIVLTSKTGSRRLDVLLEVDYKDLAGVEELKEAAAPKDMREVDGLLRLSLQGKNEPVDLLVLNKKARTPLLRFLQTASSMAITAPSGLQQPRVQPLATAGAAMKAQDAVKEVRQEEPLPRKASSGDSEEPSSQRGQRSSAKKGWSTKKKILVGCGIALPVMFIAVFGICVAAVINPEETDVPTYSLNEEVTVGKAVWELLEAKDRGSVLLGSESKYPMLTEDKTSSGKFIEITLQVTNTGTITEDWWSDPTLIDDKDTVYKPADDVYEWIPDDKQAILEPLQPRVTRQFIWIYEVPEDATGLRVKVKDIAFGSGAEALIDLGL